MGLLLGGKKKEKNTFDMDVVKKISLRKDYYQQRALTNDT